MQRVIINAKESDLKDIGIDYNIHGLSGYLIKDYQTGWYVVEIDHLIDGEIFRNEFNIPSYMCILLK